MHRKTIRCVVVALALTLFVVSGASLAQAGQGKFDVSGTWTFEVQTEAGTGTPTVTLKQSGEMLTGHYSSMTLGEADLQGTVKGDQIAFTFNANVQGMDL